MSSRHEVSLTPCYVLHQRAYRDTSVIVDVFSSQYGRVGLVARGIKSSKSKLRGLLQPFTPILVSWSGRGELQSLKTVESNGKAVHLPGSWLMSGFYLNELLVRMLIRHDTHEDLYHRYETTLRMLDELSGQQYSDPGQSEQVSGEHQRVLRLFEKYLLDELGFGLMLEQDADSGEPIDMAGSYQYFLEKGPVLNMGAHQDSVAEPVFGHATHNTYGIPISGASLLSLAQDDLRNEEVLKECKRLMRLVVANYIGSKPLYSREMLMKGHMKQNSFSKQDSKQESTAGKSYGS